MPDEQEIQVVTKQETTEIVTPPNQGASTAPAVSSMFDKILEGKQEGKSSKDVVKEQSTLKVEEPKKKVENLAPTAEKKDPTEVEKKLEGDKPEEKQEVSRDSLRKTWEDQGKDVKEENVGNKKNEKPTDEDLPESELQPKDTDKPLTQKRIKALWKKAKEWEEKAVTTQKQAEERAAKLAEVEKQLAEVKSVDPTTNDKIKEKMDELAMFRRRYELDKDPEVKGRFDGRVESAEKSITDILANNRAGEALLNAVKREGGWMNFSQSARPITISDGEGGTKTVTNAELADMMMGALSLGDRKSVEAAMLEQVQTRRDRDRYYQEEQAKANDFFKKREEEAGKSAEQNKKLIEENAKFINEWHAKAMAEEWIKDKDVPASATPQEKAEIEEHNKYNSQLRSLLDKAIKTNDLPGLMAIVGDSVKYYDELRTSSKLKKELAATKKELTAKQQELDKIKKAGSSLPKAGSIAGTSTPAQKESSGEEKPRDISSAFDHIERHGKGSLTARTITFDE